MKHHIRDVVKIYQLIGNLSEVFLRPRFSYKPNAKLLHVLRNERVHAKNFENQGCLSLSYRKHSVFDSKVALKNSGFPFETHEVVTEDGYILTLYRILKSDTYNGLFNDLEEEKPPVYLQHGLWSSSSDWLVPGTNHSLPYILSENGYDVWLGNTRGNLFSRKHKWLCPNKDSKEFWNFSWHEMGTMDLPAIIDFILNVTSKKHIYYVGHSLGTTLGFVLLTTKPQYNEKIRGMFALAPVAYLGHMRSEVLRNLANVSDRLYYVLDMTGYHSVLPREGIVSFLDNFLTQRVEVLVSNAPLLLRSLSGYANENVVKNVKDVIIAHISAGTSTKLLLHLAQCLRTKRTFRQFDLGTEKNLIEYGQKEPPSYQLSNIRVPVVLFYCDEDWLSTTKDTEELADDIEDSCKSKIIRRKIELANFNHLDFIWGTNAGPLVFSQILNYMKVF